VSALTIVEADFPEAVALAKTLPEAVKPSLTLSTLVWVIVALVVFEFTDLESYVGGLEGPESTVAVAASLFLTCHEYVQNVPKKSLTQLDIEKLGIVGLAVAVTLFWLAKIPCLILFIL
jgi:hypothetical protein